MLIVMSGPPGSGETSIADDLAQAVGPDLSVTRAFDWVRRAGHNETPEGTSGP